MNLFLFSGFTDRLNEGGAEFMYPLLFMLLICIFLLVKAFLKGDPNDKNRKLVSSISLFALVWGFLGHLVGAIVALDQLSLNSEVSYEIVAGGLKTGLLSPVFGIVVFLISRLGIIGLILVKKEK